MCLGCWGSIMQLHYNIYLYMLRSCPHHHPHGESSTLSHLHFASSMFSWCCSTSCSHIPMLQGWKTSLQVFKLGFTNYYLLYIKNKVDKLEGKVPWRKENGYFKLETFLLAQSLPLIPSERKETNKLVFRKSRKKIFWNRTSY